MSVISHSVTGVSRRLFRTLVALWLAFFGLTVLLLVIAFTTEKAQAMEPLPLPKVTREIAPPQFTNFSQVPPQGLVADRCQSLLKVRQDNRSDEANSHPSRRPAGTNVGQHDVQMVKVKAIKAYRQCRSEVALQQLAVWRWSR